MRGRECLGEYYSFLNHETKEIDLLDAIFLDKLVKRSTEAPRWLEKKVDIQGVVFFAGSRPYTRYVVGLQKTYNEGDRPFYDAIFLDNTLFVMMLGIYGKA